MPKLSFSYLALLIILLPFASCIKTSTTSGGSSFSFTYNGQAYSNIDTFSCLGGYSNFFGIEFRHNALGQVRFASNCAFLYPSGMNLMLNDNTCKFYATGPVDSSKIYIYQSGTKNFTVSDCREKSFPALGSMTVCTITGSFSLVVVNNAGQTKTITGNFKFVDVAQ